MLPAGAGTRCLRDDLIGARAGTRASPALLGFCSQQLLAELVLERSRVEGGRKVAGELLLERLGQEVFELRTRLVGACDKEAVIQP